MERTVKDYEDKVRELYNIWVIQGSDGNWNASPYMTGLFNGIELAMSIFVGREVEYKDANFIPAT